MKKNLLKTSAVLLLTGALLLSVFSLYGCGKKGLSFNNKDFAAVMAKAFSKEVNRITEEDLASIESFSMMTYSQNNYISITFAGFSEASDEEREKLSASVDITGYTLSDMSDMHYLTGLKYFYGAYLGYSNFDFLKSCTALENFILDGNSECGDYTFLSNFPNLTSLSLNECQTGSLDFVTKLTGLTSLTLNSIRIGDDIPYELDFVKPLTELTSLSVEGNWFEDLSPLKELKKLTRIDFSYGSIEDVSPLADMPQLTFINLTQNCVRDVSSLTTFDPENFDRIILDLNSSITDWSPLDYLGDKVQGRPTTRDLEEANGNTASDAADEEPTDTQKPTVLDPSGEPDFENGYGDNEIDISDFDF